MPTKRTARKSTGASDPISSSDPLFVPEERHESPKRKPATGRKSTASTTNLKSGGTRKATRGGRKQATSRQQADPFNETCTAFEEEAKNMCDVAEGELTSQFLQHEAFGGIQAAVDDGSGDKALEIYKKRLLVWRGIGEKVINLYTKAEEYPQQRRQKEVPEIQVWDRDVKGMSEIIDSGLQHSKKTIEHLLVGTDEPELQEQPQPESVRLGWSDEDMFSPPSPQTEAEIIAEENFGSQEDQDGWGMVARGHLKTWVGFLKGAQDSGFILEDEDEDEMTKIVGKDNQ